MVERDTREQNHCPLVVRLIIVSPALTVNQVARTTCQIILLIISSSSATLFVHINELLMFRNGNQLIVLSNQNNDKQRVI